jgi:hypothetical protein
MFKYLASAQINDIVKALLRLLNAVAGYYESRR